MHGLETALGEVRRLAQALDARPPAARVAICPPATLLSRLSQAVSGTRIEVGGQDCRPENSGPFTGDIAPEMLVDAGATLVILGHSERRTLHHETDAQVSAKVAGALRAGLAPVVCVGESLEDHRAGRAVRTVERQVRGSLAGAPLRAPLAIAYEPLWAIGSGQVPTLHEIEEVHRAIRFNLVEMFGESGRSIPLLYGGSVKGSNAAEILACENVDGALVGGGSLRAADFIAIIHAA